MDIKKEISYHEYVATDTFVRRTFYACQALLAMILILILVIVGEGWYNHIPIANTILLTVGGGCTVILFTAMCTCRHTPTLRVAGSILVTTFIGLFFGFTTACNLKLAVAQMDASAA